jgi:predicted RNA-binding Zn-ribbon protein involved in translation (DUF1610 family)
MKTLTEVNKERMIRYEGTPIHKDDPLANFTCPKCKRVMRYSSPNILLLSDPPKRKVYCDKCGLKDYVIE